MATIAKRWVETHCAHCEGRRVFEVKDGWLLVCSACGAEKSLEKSGILAA
jgi:ribosomal protein L37E